MRKIVIISTLGCASCKIVRERMLKALRILGKEIDIEIIDFGKITKDYPYRKCIKDFPTTIFIRDNENVFSFTGTRPDIVLARFIDFYLYDKDWGLKKD